MESLTAFVLPNEGKDVEVKMCQLLQPNGEWIGRVRNGDDLVSIHARRICGDRCVAKVQFKTYRGAELMRTREQFFTFEGAEITVLSRGIEEDAF